MQKISILYLLGFLLLVLSLTACNGAAQTTPTVDANAKVTEAVLTVYAQMTQAATEAPPPTATNTAVPSPTPTIVQPTQIPTEVPAEEAGDQEGGEAGDGGDAGDDAGGAVPTSTLVPTNPPAPTENPEAGMPCYRANLEYETIPDGTEFYPGRKFTKMWRLKNTGSCTWNENFFLKFVDGDLLNAPANVRLTNERVPTWGFVNVEVDMTAPAKTGTHKGHWMIVSDDGKIFGIGPEGEGWFWVEIEVIPVEE